MLILNVQPYVYMIHINLVLDLGVLSPRLEGFVYQCFDASLACCLSAVTMYNHTYFWVLGFWCICSLVAEFVDVKFALKHIFVVRLMLLLWLSCLREDLPARQKAIYFLCFNLLMWLF